MAKIFISYSRKDTDKVNSLVKFLEPANHDVWVDTNDIRAGSQWQTSIVQAIAESKFFIIVLSKNSTKSDNVRRELVIAVNHKKEIIPVCLHEVELSPEMQYQLAGIQWINFDNDSPKEQAALLSVLDKEESAVTRTVTKPHLQFRIKKNHVWAALGIFALGSLAVAIALFVPGLIEKPPESPEIEIQNISVKEYRSSSTVELDIKVANNGNNKAYLHTVLVHIKDYKIFYPDGCFPALGGGGVIEPSGTYHLDITSAGIGGTKKLSFYHDIEAKEADRFLINLRPKFETKRWILYKLNLELIYTKDDMRVLSKPIFFISEEPVPEEWITSVDGLIPTPAKFLYGYQLSDDEILKRYDYLLQYEPLMKEYGLSSEKDIIPSVRTCHEENLRSVTDIFSDEDIMLSKEKIFLSDQAGVIFDEWNKVIKEAP